MNLCLKIIRPMNFSVRAPLSRACVAGVCLTIAAAAPGGPLIAEAHAEATAKEIARRSSERLQRIEEVLQDEVDKGLRAGFVAMVGVKDGVVYETSVGDADREAGRKMTVDTRFRIASMTKPIVSAAAVRLIEEGRLSLGDPVKLYIPSFADPVVAVKGDKRADGTYETRAASRDIMVRDLFTHTSGLGYAFLTKTDLDKDYINANPFFFEGSLAESIDAIAALPLYFDPGERWQYSYAIDVLGRVVEVASGMELGAYLKETFFDPLGMADTEFLLDDADVPALAKVYGFDDDGKLIPEPPDGLGRSVNDEAFGVASGGGGLISTASDYMRFCRMLLNEGELDGERVLSRASVRSMMTDHLPESARSPSWRAQGLTFGLGGQIVEKPGWAGASDAPGDWRWGGYWDTSFVVNAADDVAVIVLSQRQPGPYDPGSRASALVKAIAYGAVTSAD